MSIAAYLTSHPQPRRLSPKTAIELGATFNGPVLCGESTLSERLTAESATTSALNHYDDVTQYDPVLRAHCHLPEPPAQPRDESLQSVPVLTKIVKSEKAS